jgi:hypothetical protein
MWLQLMAPAIPASPATVGAAASLTHRSARFAVGERCGACAATAAHFAALTVRDAQMHWQGFAFDEDGTVRVMKRSAHSLTLTGGNPCCQTRHPGMAWNGSIRCFDAHNEHNSRLSKTYSDRPRFAAMRLAADQDGGATKARKNASRSAPSSELVIVRPRIAPAASRIRTVIASGRTNRHGPAAERRPTEAALI